MKIYRKTESTSRWFKERKREKRGGEETNRVELSLMLDNHGEPVSRVDTRGDSNVASKGAAKIIPQIGI